MDKRICEIEHCVRASYQRRLCYAHHMQREAGTAFTALPIVEPVDHSAPCLFRGCTRGGKRTRGYCSGHYSQLRSGKALSALRDRPPEHAQGLPCTIPDCQRPIVAKGMCHGHYYQQYHGKEPGPIRLQRKRGSGHISVNGYLLVTMPDHPNAMANGMLPEHRLVMSNLLGRPLLDHENVHHINGDRLDNRPENLELWSTTQPKGQRVADKVAWARQILSLYGDDF